MVSIPPQPIIKQVMMVFYSTRAEVFNEENRCLFRREECITYKFSNCISILEEDYIYNLHFLTKVLLGSQFSFLDLNFLSGDVFLPLKS